MAFKVFLDANIVLDFTLQREVGYQYAKEIIGNALDRNLSAFTTPSVIHIVGYYLKKTHGVLTTKQMLLSLLSDLRTIDIPYTTVLQALQSNVPEVEDSLQYYSALHHHLDYFISRDKPLFKYALPQLPIISPKDFISQFL